MKNRRFLLLPLLLIGGLVGAQGPITTAVPFLSVAPDARGSGLANCGVASEADVFSMYYNPAKTSGNLRITNKPTKEVSKVLLFEAFYVFLPLNSLRWQKQGARKAGHGVGGSGSRSRN